MLISGDITIKQPGLKKQRILFENGTEFILNVDNSPKEKVDFGVWFELDRGNTTIKTDFKDDETIRDSITLYIESSNKKSLGLSLSLKQAQVIKDILEHYIKASHSCKALLESHIVKNQQAR